MCGLNEAQLAFPISKKKWSDSKAEENPQTYLFMGIQTLARHASQEHVPVALFGLWVSQDINLPLEQAREEWHAGYQTQLQPLRPWIGCAHLPLSNQGNSVTNY